MRLVVLLSMLALGAPAPNAGGTEIKVKPRLNGEIRGRVVHLETGKPFQYADARLVGTKLRGVTVEDGSFVIRDVPPGNYTLRVSAMAYGIFELTEIAISWSDALSISIPLPLEVHACCAPGNQLKKVRSFKYSDFIGVERFLKGTLEPRLIAKDEIFPWPSTDWNHYGRWHVGWRQRSPLNRRRPPTTERLESRHLENTRLERRAVTWTETWRRRLE